MKDVLAKTDFLDTHPPPPVRHCPFGRPPVRKQMSKTQNILQSGSPWSGGGGRGVSDSKTDSRNVKKIVSGRPVEGLPSPPLVCVSERIKLI